MVGPNSLTVIVPTIPGREEMLKRALRSIDAQTMPPYEVRVVVDKEGRGAAVTRNRGLAYVITPWVTFLDDDDEMKPEHLAVLTRNCASGVADIFYPWYEVEGGTDPRPHLFGQPFDADNPTHTTIVTVIRTALLRSIGGFHNPGNINTPGRKYLGEDFDMINRALAIGARVSHIPQKTWVWHHHTCHTSGLPSRREA